MFINPQTSADQPSASPKLAPELQRMLTELQLHLGQRVTAAVSEIVPLTEGERQQLLDIHNSAQPSPSQRALLTALQDAEVKLVELVIKDRLIPALTNLPVSRSSQVQVLVTPRGLMVLPSPTENPSVPQTARVTSDRGPASPVIAASMIETARGIAQALKTGSRGGSIADVPPSTPSKLTVSALPPDWTDAPSRTTTLAQRAAIASTLAQVLPTAQPLKSLLQLADQAQQRLSSMPPPPPESPLAQLGKLFGSLRETALDLSTMTPQRPENLQRAILHSGVFYERQLVDQRGQPAQPPNHHLRDMDPKGALIQLSQWTGVPMAAPTSQSGPTILEQLLAGLADIFTPRHNRRTEDTSKQLAHAIQHLAKKSLAQVQLQQLRTLSSQIGESANPVQWHLDIPLKLADSYGNLYLNIVEPRVAPKDDQPKERKKKDREQKGRWKVFMQLELEQLGELAAEISVYDKTVEATLWTAQNELRERATAHLRELKDDLERQGMLVKDLRCSQNPPPEQKIRLDYALIDVKT